MPQWTASEVFKTRCFVVRHVTVVIWWPPSPLYGVTHSDMRVWGSATLAINLWGPETAFALTLTTGDNWTSECCCYLRAQRLDGVIFRQAKRPESAAALTLFVDFPIQPWNSLARRCKLSYSTRKCFLGGRSSPLSQKWNIFSAKST